MASPGRRPRSFSPRLGRTALYLGVALGAIVFAFPFAWLISSSLKPESQVFRFPPSFLPSSFEWSTYTAAISSFPFLQSLSNTLIIVMVVEIGRLISVPLAAYAFAHMRFPLRTPLFVLVLSTMLLPYQVLIIPQYLLFRDFGWLNTFLPLTVPSFLAGGSLGAYSIFLVRQFFMSIPRDYAEAAEIDGCGFLRIYWYIILPLSKPVLVAVAIFSFLQEWNDFFGPLIYLTSQSKYTLALQFQIWSQTAQVSVGYQPKPYDEILAVATLITLIPILVFFIAQRYFIRGVVLSGVKG
jgi:ABC-type glycerol-3-phosphate transport system permease component